MLEIKDKKVLIVGLGKSGISCARFLKNKGAVVTATDCKSFDNLNEEAKRLKSSGIRIEANGHRIETFMDADIIVMSPGVSMDIQPVKLAREKGITVISEIELAYNFIKTPIIAITGTNGKTTTTSLIGEVLRKSQREVFIGGNIGNPLIEYISIKKEKDYVVAEISSFQLEGVVDFKPNIAILLNISPDHLDRYPSYQEYIKAKERIFINQGKEDVAILNADDPLILKIADSLKNIRKIYFSMKKKIDKGVYLEVDSIVSEIDNQKYFYSTEKFKIKGTHNMENIMAAIAAAQICKCDNEQIKDAIDNFTGLEHRMEFVKEISGVQYYNDSKATNAGAVEKSLMSFNQPVILIAGGKDKGTGYDRLKGLVNEKVKRLILLGEAKEILLKDLGSLTQTLTADSLQEAVELAWLASSPGDIVLLSPACSSFDMFSDYKERGKIFKATVSELEEKAEKIRKEVNEAT
ncbi:MAG: UDP-N-acetylmuramoyl-L-alanine--D-glutamate ligase [Thermodesulfobacteriota bacterium]|nr:UDP-N-acetylmuramoyl-L-alanine--D-glutamate ligase [Thermodesulfobacteriota bacterium]